METATPVPAHAPLALRCWTPEPFSPRPGLRGPHRQTLAAALIPRRFSLPETEIRYFQVEPGIRVMCHCHWQDRPALTILLVHGFEGSSHSHYVLGTAGKAWAAGMSVVRMNIRNCGGTEHLGPTLYHSGLSQDIGVIARELLEQHHDRVAGVAIAGFSLGGNQVLKLAGELGPQVPAGVRAVAAVSPGVDLIESSRALHEWSNRLYEWNFLRSVRRTLRRKRRIYPQVCAPEGVRWYRSVRDFDHCVTAPSFGFASAEDYYTRASASPHLPRIAVPALILASADDPFIRLTAQTRARIHGNPNLMFVETQAGGHCGFLAAASGYDGFWAERQVVEFFCQF